MDSTSKKPLYLKWWAILVEICIVIGGFYSAYLFGYNQGQIKFDSEKIKLQRENDTLKTNASNLKKRVINLESDSSYYIKTLATLWEIDTLYENPNGHATIGQKKRKGKIKTQITTSIPIVEQSKEDTREKILTLQTKLDFYKEQSKKLLQQNDTLKSYVSFMQQQLQTARELEQQVENDTNSTNRSELQNEIGDILASVDSEMKKLNPPFQARIKHQVDTVKIIQTSPVNYENKGDEYFKQANAFATELINEPNKVALLFKNKTKADFTNKVLILYDSANACYTRACCKNKINITKDTKVKFKKDFNL